MIIEAFSMKEAVVSHFNNLRDKKELMNYADQYLAYGSYQDALMCYDQALQIAEKTENITESFHSVIQSVGYMRNYRNMIGRFILLRKPD